MAGRWGRQHARACAAFGGALAVLSLLLAALGRTQVGAAAWLAALGLLGVVARAARKELLDAREAAVAGLVRALEVRDRYTGEHTQRVARYSVYIGEELGLSRRRLERLRHSALLHDVGKLVVPVELLNKPAPLTEEEAVQVQRHASVCTDILRFVDVLRPLAAAAEGHHRRFDGAGYGRHTDAVVARVVAVADAYDAMTSTRAYRRALRQEVAFDELRARAGTQFDPVYVEALVQAVRRRGERHGLGFERTNVVYAVDPPVVGVLSCGH